MTEQGYAMYEVEVWKNQTGEEGYFHSTIIEGRDMPAGEWPPEVEAHARLLAQIQGPGTEYRIGYTRPLRIRPDGSKREAWTVWLTDTPMRIGS